MSNEQASELLNFAALLALAIWRWYVSRTRNTPQSTEVRLTNGYKKDLSSGNKIQTDEWKRFVDREYALDKNRDDLIQSHQRNLSILTERFLTTQDRMNDMERRLFKLENSFEQTVQALARIEASQSSINVMLTNMNKGNVVQ